MDDVFSRKLNKFVNSVLSATTQEAAQIDEDLRRRHADALYAYEVQLRAEIRRYTEARRAEISTREARRISAAKNENHHTLLQLREDYAKEVFAAVREKIEAFTQSPEYARHMASLLGRAIDQLGYGFAADVYLRPEDMHLVQYLRGSTTGVSLSFEEAGFALGGLRLVCPARGLRLDLSFDTAIEDRIGHFSELSGITV